LYRATLAEVAGVSVGEPAEAADPAVAFGRAPLLKTGRLDVAGRAGLKAEMGATLKCGVW
jgi:hypothetical protein